ncbi:hypothetical protein J5N97_016985 [Dioscorea zingiberensis]|uniref:Uncharacterized protein n=1 Tax=Dioscorea zingiberensis TaxID=325984 RepID=A0A9D5CKW0_9LILI|nr:hypothetical protein J5N97_016985 [Dioscorea zingiberensis]
MSSPAVVDVVGFIIGSPNGPSQEKTARSSQRQKTKNATKGAETSELEEGRGLDKSSRAAGLQGACSTPEREDGGRSPAPLAIRLTSSRPKLITSGGNLFLHSYVGLGFQTFVVLQRATFIIQALKRLKGTSSDKRGKMSETTKQIFDQLTEGAVKLMENGDYKGYRRLAHAKGGLDLEAVRSLTCLERMMEEANVNVQLDECCGVWFSF